MTRCEYPKYKLIRYEFAMYLKITDIYTFFLKRK